MALSPNYGWAEPDNSSLVKNGAQDIRALGDAIDTSLWNVGYGQAGKNKIINGDFSINQRNFTSTTTNGTFGFDRFTMNAAGGTSTYSAQTFTPGAAPVAGYEATNFARLVTSGQSANGDFAALRQAIEDVRTFAGQTVTISFWAKASTGTPKVGIQLNQSFGSGGSSDVFGTASQVTLSTSWARYSVSVSVPSISGKTVGTSSALFLWLMTSVGTTISGLGYPAVGLQNATIDFWGVQVEYGSKATPFETATGTIQGELAACQRYYWQFTSSTNVYARFGTGNCSATTNASIYIRFPVTMRSAPAALATTGTASNYCLVNASGSVVALNAVPTYDATNTEGAVVAVTVASGLVAGNATQLLSNNTLTAYLAWSAEL